MSRLHLRVYLVTALSCSLWACTDDLAGDGDGSGDSSASASNGDGDGDGDGETSAGDGDGDVCNIAETTEVEGCPAIVGEGFCSEGGVHVEQDSEIDYSNNPPHSGDHYPTWETWGEHDMPVPRGNWVHNMEHGAIVLVYNCPEAEPCDEELDVLRSVIDALPDRRMLMTEDSLLDGPRFAAVSWNWVHEFDAPDLDELVCFVEQHYNHAPESVL